MRVAPFSTLVQNFEDVWGDEEDVSDGSGNTGNPAAFIMPTAYYTLDKYSDSGYNGYN